MKTKKKGPATKATSAYKAKFGELMAAGYRLTNYGSGWRYFAKRRDDGKDDVVRVNAKTGKSEDCGVQ